MTDSHMFGHKRRRLMTEHLEAEYPVRTDGRRRQVHEWRLRPECFDDDWLDGGRGLRRGSLGLRRGAGGRDQGRGTPQDTRTVVHLAPEVDGVGCRARAHCPWAFVFDVHGSARRPRTCRTDSDHLDYVRLSDRLPRLCISSLPR